MSAIVVLVDSIPMSKPVPLSLPNPSSKFNYNIFI